MIIAAVAIFLLASAYLAYQLLRPAATNKEGKNFYIREGTTIPELKKALQDHQLIQGSGFDLACKILRFKKPKPGRYLVKDGMNNFNLVRMLRGGHQSLVKITIVKERTKELLSAKMGFGKKFDLQFDSMQMISYLNNNDSLKKFGVDTFSALAIIIPDTYMHKWNSSPGKLMQQFYAFFQKFWNEGRMAKAKAKGLNPVQVMILASIVEEETNRPDDRMNVASVYLNRLKKGMKLQADPTVKFVTRNFQLGRILYAHLKLESPYNTYLNEGLPPGPICTPSVAAIEAVLNAPETNYLYFVASYLFDGSSIFTSNLEDHNKYARLFHQEQNRRTDSIKKLKTQSTSIGKEDKK